MWERLGWLAERWRRQWRQDGPYGVIIPAVVVFVAAKILENEAGDTSALGWIISVALGVAAWSVVKWVRNRPSTDPGDDRSS